MKNYTDFAYTRFTKKRNYVWGRYTKFYRKKIKFKKKKVLDFGCGNILTSYLFNSIRDLTKSLDLAPYPLYVSIGQLTTNVFFILIY